MTLRRSLPAISLACGLLLLVWVMRAFPISDVIRAVLRLGPGIFLTVAAALSWHACNTFAFRALLGDAFSFFALFYNRLVGDAYNNLLPLAGLGGEPFKLRHLTTRVPVPEATLALIRDRVIESTFGVAFSCVGIVAILLGATFPTALPVLLRGALWMIAAVFAVITGVAILAVRSSLPAKLGGRLTAPFGAGTPPLHGMSARQLLRVVCWHLPARMLGWAEVAILLHLLRVPMSLPTVVLVDNFLHVAGFIGFAIPQGLGVQEGASVYILGVFGQSGPEAIAFSLARRGRGLLVSVLGIALHLASLPRRASQG